MMLERRQGLNGVWAESGPFSTYRRARRALREAGFVQDKLTEDMDVYVCHWPTQQISARAWVDRRWRDDRITVRVIYFNQDGEMLRHWPDAAAAPLPPSPHLLEITSRVADGRTSPNP
jgi:hypothetical protein